MPKTEATLRVVEALQQDVSYGRARLDGQTRVELNLSPGDNIEIKGQKTTAAVVFLPLISMMSPGLRFISTRV